MIRDVNVKKDGHGKITKVQIVFGPHHFLELESRDGKVSFSVGATHHGIRLDASEVNSELEQAVNELRRLFPEKAID